MAVEKASLGRSFFARIIDYILMFLVSTVLSVEVVRRFEKQRKYDWESEQKSPIPVM